MLLRNGPGLFALAISRVLWRASTRVGYLIAPLQLSVLNWSPDQQGVFNQLIMPTLNIPLSRLVVQVILPPAPGVSNEGPRSRVLVPLPAVSWPWVPAWGSLEPPRRDG